jgi:hypothetical protein
MGGDRSQLNALSRLYNMFSWCARAKHFLALTVGEKSVGPARLSIVVSVASVEGHFFFVVVRYFTSPPSY